MSYIVYGWCRLNESDSLINSHIYRPRCVSVLPVPSICQCVGDGSPACVSENFLILRSLPTVTYWTTLTNTCNSPQSRRYLAYTCHMFCRTICGRRLKVLFHSTNAIPVRLNSADPRNLVSFRPNYSQTLEF